LLTVITHAAQLVTPPGDSPRIGDDLNTLTIIEDGGLLARDGTIVAVDDTDKILRLADSQPADEVQVIEARGGTVLPGFVDAHTHPVFAGTREDEFEMRIRGASYEEIASSGGGILSTVQRTRAASDDELDRAAGRYSDWFLNHGTTTIEAKSGYGLTLESEIRILRAIKRIGGHSALECVPTLLAAHAIPDEYGSRPDAYVELVIDEILPVVAAEGLADYCDVFCEPGFFDLAQTRRICIAARKNGLGIRLHADQLSLSGGAELAASLGAASADHLEEIDEAGIAALAGTNCTAVLLPASVFMLGRTGYPPARKLIEAGVSVALATDFNPGTSPVASMQLVLTIACSHLGMTPAETISAATLNAACSLARGGRIGSLIPGAQADAVIFDCANYREIPYFAGVNHVRSVIKRGRLIT
jgi:imidazolonepropionase